MRKALLLIFFACTLPLAGAIAQNIALGERTPEIKPSAWLGEQQPGEAEMTYIEFFHSSNPSCATSLEKLKEMVNKSDGKLRVIVIAQEKEAVITPVLSPYLSPRMAVALDPQGKIFTAYGVSYVPFGVLTDARGRALWLGNSLQITEQIIEQSK